MSTIATLFEVVRADDRFQYEAYTFVFEALSHTEQRLGRGVAKESQDHAKPHKHVSGAELVRGMCDLAREEFGLLSPVVFRTWGLRRTDDIGEIVFQLIEAKLLSKTESDSRADFHDLFDLDAALREDQSMSIDELDWPKRGIK